VSQEKHPGKILPGSQGNQSNLNNSPFNSNAPLQGENMISSTDTDLHGQDENIGNRLQATFSCAATPIKKILIADKLTSSQSRCNADNLPARVEKVDENEMFELQQELQRCHSVLQWVAEEEEKAQTNFDAQWQEAEQSIDRTFISIDALSELMIIIDTSVLSNC